MKKILIGGAGGAPSEGVINSLLLSPKQERIIGMGSEPTDLALSGAGRKYWVPYADSADYPHRLMHILTVENPDLVHFQNDLEIFHASRIRDEIHATGTKTFMPDHDVIDTCVHKYKTYLKFREAGISVPTNRLIGNERDLLNAFAELGDHEGTIWLRASSIGGGAKGALPTADYGFAKAWIDHYRGWGEFVAAENLTPRTVTNVSIWYQGRLVVSQNRKRDGWVHGNRTLSGISGVTKVGTTCSDPDVDEIAERSVKAVSYRPHGIFGVDMTYDSEGTPNPTEINISRFFTTVLFFTQAGLNLPVIFKDLALYGEFPKLERKRNPLPDGLMWLRGMDTLPRLCTDEDLKKELLLA